MDRHFVFVDVGADGHVNPLVAVAQDPEQEANAAESNNSAPGVDWRGPT